MLAPPFEGILTAVERGTLPDWRRLAAAVRADPWGPVAQQVLEAVEMSRPYGTTESGALTHSCRAAQACRPSSVSSRANASSAAPRRGASEPSRAGTIGGGGIARKAISPSW